MALEMGLLNLVLDEGVVNEEMKRIKENLKEYGYLENICDEDLAEKFAELNLEAKQEDCSNSSGDDNGNDDRKNMKVLTEEELNQVLDFSDRFLLEMYSIGDDKEEDELYTKQVNALGEDGIIDNEFGTKMYFSKKILVEDIYRDSEWYNIAPSVVIKWCEFLLRSQLFEDSAASNNDNSPGANSNDICTGLKKSLQVAKTAEYEIPNVMALNYRLPGEYNRICVDRFIYNNESLYFDPAKIGGMDSNEEDSLSDLDVYGLMNLNLVSSEKTASIFTIVTTIRPNTVVLEKWTNDKTDTTIKNNTKSDPKNINCELYKIFVEADTLKYCTKGINIFATMNKLSNDIYFISDFSRVLPSFAPLDYHLF
ncbi:hypothetical protein AX774_g2599 [Zancudomyces culisetae]|uniref:Uncharacterized protein n=1 Tax=Zancudomyces culisetae TaxID=1213189 RepID=A0A1R1PSF7_ZANCU|nr:hypothetical protein AX774_g2599 [Zancudomyces culisetae]|eukprot:OMH83884.1 hypothetical protein AX774_g2599 [Zancudomyces culisetae]